METNRLYSGPRASMAANANNIYLTWWDNKTGNNEVYFGKSNDSGKSFGKPINLSDDKGGSADSQIAATPNNVYVTWWDNSTGNWQVFSRSSNDTGKTFGNAVMIKAVGSTPVKHLNAPPSNTTSVDPIVVYDGGSSSAGSATTTAPSSSSSSSSSPPSPPSSSATGVPGLP